MQLLDGVRLNVHQNNSIEDITSQELMIIFVKMNQSLNSVIMIEWNNIQQAPDDNFPAIRTRSRLENIKDHVKHFAIENLT
jgi:hypothetical protein